MRRGGFDGARRGRDVRGGRQRGVNSCQRCQRYLCTASRRLDARDQRKLRLGAAGRRVDPRERRQRRLGPAHRRFDARERRLCGAVGQRFAGAGRRRFGAVGRRFEAGQRRVRRLDAAGRRVDAFERRERRLGTRGRRFDARQRCDGGLNALEHASPLGAHCRKLPVLLLAALFEALLELAELGLVEPGGLLRSSQGDHGLLELGEPSGAERRMLSPHLDIGGGGECLVLLATPLPARVSQETLEPWPYDDRQREKTGQLMANDGRAAGRSRNDAGAVKRRQARKKNMKKNLGITAVTGPALVRRPATQGGTSAKSLTYRRR